MPPVDDQVHETPHFLVHCPAGSFAEKNLGAVSARLETAYRVMADLLGLGTASAADQRIDVYLPEIPAAPSPAGTAVAASIPEGRPSVRDVYRPESPGTAIEHGLLVILLGQATGHDRAVPPLIVDGLMATIMQRLGALTRPATPGANGEVHLDRGGLAATSTPAGSVHLTGEATLAAGGVAPQGNTAAPAVGTVRGGLAGAGQAGAGPGGPSAGPRSRPPGGRPPGPDAHASPLLQAKAANQLPPLRAFLGGPPPGSRPLYFAAAASFVGFLLGTQGVEKFRLFVAHATPDTLDPAAHTAYHQSFAQLEKSWLKSLKAPEAGGVIHLIATLLPFIGPRWPAALEIVLEIAFTVWYATFFASIQTSLIDVGLGGVPPDQRARELGAYGGLIGILPNAIDNALGTAPGTGGDIGVVIATIIELVVGFVLISAISFRQSYAMAKFAQSVGLDIRLRMFNLIQRLEMGFFQKMQTGDVLERMTSDVATAEGAISQGLPAIVQTVLMVVIAGITLLALNWRFAILLLIGAPFIFVTGRYMGPIVARASRTRRDNQARLTSTAQEDLAAQPVVKAFGLEEPMERRYSSELQTFFRSSLHFSVVGGLTNLAALSITTAINVAAMGLGAWLVLQSRSPTPTAFATIVNGNDPITSGALFTTLGLLGQVVSAVQGINSIFQGFQQATGPMDRVSELMAAKPEIADPPDAQPLPRMSDAIHFENVFFGYDPTQPVLQDVSLTIRAGASVGLVGTTGGGKSTTLGLIQRFYDPQKGRVTFDGVDARKAALSSLRGQEGVVFQESVLFNLSVRENIRMGQPTATDAQVEEAAREAEIHDAILALPDGYDTLVGERGGRLSGGQRQRVAIARAIVRNPAILILDEATSALDPGTEAAINATLRRLAEGRTTISVTHRLVGVMHANHIYVFDRGRIVEHGTHDQLLAHEGLYARLWSEQTGALSVPAVGPRAMDAGRLQKVPLFASLPPAELTGLAERLQAERYPAGDDVIRQGDAGDKLYLLEQGQVEVVVADPSGAERRLATLHEGDYFGEIALIHDVTRTATVRALSPVLVDSLSKDDFLRELSMQPALRQTMEQAIARRTATTAVPSPPSAVAAPAGA